MHEGTQDAAPALRIDIRGAQVQINLMRTEQRNAFDGQMIAALSTPLDGWARSPDVYAVSVSSTVPGVFSIGSDLPRMLDAQQSGDVGQILAADYRFFWQVDCFTKPIISLINGAIAGAALGIALHGTHRVAQENFTLAVPEVSLGMVPQAGLSYRLARLPDYAGIYLALTGRSLARADALAYGLVTHSIDSRHSHDIQRQLADAQPVDPLLDTLHRDPGPRDLDYFAPVISRCFSAGSVDEILVRLFRERGQSQLWAEAVQRDISRHSPLALKATHRLLRECADLDLRQSLQLTHRVLTRLVMQPDFSVGVNAALVQRNRAPVWPSGSLQRVTDQVVSGLFEPLDRAALELPARLAMQRR